MSLEAKPIAAQARENAHKAAVNLLYFLQLIDESQNPIKREHYRTRAKIEILTLEKLKEVM